MHASVSKHGTVDSSPSSNSYGSLNCKTRVMVMNNNAPINTILHTWADVGERRGICCWNLPSQVGVLSQDCPILLKWHTLLFGCVKCLWKTYCMNSTNTHISLVHAWQGYMGYLYRICRVMVVPHVWGLVLLYRTCQFPPTPHQAPGVVGRAYHWQTHNVMTEINAQSSVSSLRSSLCISILSHF